MGPRTQDATNIVQSYITSRQALSGKGLFPSVRADP